MISYPNENRESALSQKSSRRLITMLLTVLNQVIKCFSDNTYLLFPSWVRAVLVPGVRGLTKDLHFMTFLQCAPCVRDGACDTVIVTYLQVAGLGS